MKQAFFSFFAIIVLSFIAIDSHAATINSGSSITPNSHFRTAYSDTISPDPSRKFRYNMPNFFEEHGRGLNVNPRFYRDFRFGFPDSTIRRFNVPNRPQLGIRIQDTKDGDGVKVLSVTEGSAAEKAGVKEGDLIQKINDKDIRDVGSALMEMRRHSKEDFDLQIKRKEKR